MSLQLLHILVVGQRIPVVMSVWHIGSFGEVLIHVECAILTIPAHLVSRPFIRCKPKTDRFVFYFKHTKGLLLLRRPAIVEDYSEAGPPFPGVLMIPLMPSWLLQSWPHSIK